MAHISSFIPKGKVIIPTAPRGLSFGVLAKLIAAALAIGCNTFNNTNTKVIAEISKQRVVT